LSPLGLVLAGPVPVLDPLDLGLRVAGAAVLGGLVGLERELHDRPAGFRTHILVSLGSCLFTMAGAYGVGPFFQDGGGAVSFDPTRVAAQVVAGIGFLGAGAIIRNRGNVQGLTTAAALWVTAAIGLAVGLGYWAGAAAVAGATVAALYGLKRLEKGLLRRLGHARRHEFILEALPGLTVADLAGVVEKNKARIEMIHTESDDQGNRRLELTIALLGGGDPARVADALGALEGVSAVDWAT
jgi:putative Mg2+ transporter-C (MgtC) family protein